MGDGGDEIVFHLFGVAQLLRHVVDGGAQLPNLIVLFHIQPHPEVPLGNLFGGLAHLPNGDDDGVDEIDAGIEDKEQDGGPQQAGKEHQGADLPVDAGEGDHIPHGGKVVADDAGHHGDSHNLFVSDIAHIFPHPGLGGIGPVVVRHLRGIPRLEAAGGDDDVFIPVNGHQLGAVLVLVILHHPAQLEGKIRRAVLGVVFQEGSHRIGAGKEKLPGAVVVVAVHRNGDGYYHHHHNKKHHAEAVDQPPPGDFLHPLFLQRTHLLSRVRPVFTAPLPSPAGPDRPTCTQSPKRW